MADEWQDYFVPRRFQARELPTVLPEDSTERVSAWCWGPQSKEDYQPLIVPGNFLVREYNMGEDLWEYKVVRRENFLEYYQKGTGNAEQITRTEKDYGSDCTRVETAEGLPGGKNSEESGKGIQQGRRGEKQAREIAVAYATTVDGWVAIAPRAIRNTESPHIVWMLQATWEHLATHADIRGLFFIPCETAPDAQHLRMLVNAKEIADAS